MGTHTRSSYLTVLAVAVACASPAVAQDWVQPPRSQANLAALARVELKTYRFEEADGKDQEYRVYEPTAYGGADATPLVIALHGLGSGTMYMMEYNNLVEEAERHGFLVATPMGYNERGWYGARGEGNDFQSPSRGSGTGESGSVERAGRPQRVGEHAGGLQRR